jgi:hypothetical protein
MRMAVVPRICWKLAQEDDDSVHDLPGDGDQEGEIDVENEFEVMDNLSQQINTMFLRRH